MTTAPQNETGDGRSAGDGSRTQEPENLAPYRILAVLAITIAFSSTLVLLAYLVLARHDVQFDWELDRSRAWGGPNAPPALYERVASDAGALPVLREYKWVDRDERIVAVPIERAFEVLLHQQASQQREDPR